LAAAAPANGAGVVVVGPTGVAVALPPFPPLGLPEVMTVLLLMEVGALPLEFGAGPVVRVGRMDVDVVLLQGTVTVVYEYVTVVNGIEIEEAD
jgi:hypothetical protein